MVTAFAVGLAILFQGAGAIAIGRLWGRSPALWRIFSAAAWGGFYVALSLKVPWFGAWHWRTVSLAFGGVLVFGGNWKKVISYILLLLGIEGFAGGVGVERRYLGVLLIGGALLLCRSMSQPKAFVPVVLRLGDRQLKIKALRDTGNTLRDPISGSPVLIIDERSACQLTGLCAEQLNRPVEVMRQPPIQGLRLIPYRAVGVADGLLLGMRLRFVQVGSWKGSLTVAFAPEEFCDNGEFQALIGGTI